MIKDEAGKVRIPLRDGENTVRFPNRCAYCAEPPTGAINLDVGARRELGESREGPIVRRSYLYKGVHMSVPYCAKHLTIAKVGRWFFLGIGLPVLILGVVIMAQITENTFLNEGDILPIVRVLLALAVGMALSQGATWVARKVSGLVFPVVNDIPLWLTAGTGQLGVKVEMTYEKFALTLRNPSVAEAVRQLNTGQPGAATTIEVWPEPAKAARSSSATTSRTGSRSTTRSRAIGGWVALVIGVLILGGACLCIGLAVVSWIIGGQGISPVCP